ncbi:hypothetical protein [Oricola sp.]|uniref:hypothetical protein n=1 Tax=Oricola sp. TaxID=1979950 RepID=UPI00320BD80B|nr:hypothetical protein [Oricola sp.]
MSEKSRHLFSSVGRAFTGVLETLALANEMNTISHTPESTFRARGTTRDAALRAALKRL